GGADRCGGGPSDAEPAGERYRVPELADRVDRWTGGTGTRRRVARRPAHERACPTHPGQARKDRTRDLSGYDSGPEESTNYRSSFGAADVLRPAPQPLTCVPGRRRRRWRGPSGHARHLHGPRSEGAAEPVRETPW